MTHDPMQSLHPSREARYVFAYLRRRGGSMRLEPLQRHLRMEPRDLVAAITDLAELYWITIVWRRPTPGTPADEPRPLTDIDRLCTTRFGRKKYRATGPTH
jgi:hypothetical protein